MTPLAISQPDQNFWWIAIGIAVVVILCVVVLLSLLSAFVRDIDHNVVAVTDQITSLARNTSASPTLPRAAELIGDLGTELQQLVELYPPRDAGS